MRIELNLATRPLENQRRFYVLTGTSAVLLLLLAGIQGTIFFRDWWSGREVGKQTERLRAEVGRLEGGEKKLEQELEQPRAQQVMERSNFLNSLLRHKGISWTQIFMDLEKLVPDRVQVTSIRPEVLDSNRVRLEMTVSGESVQQLLEFLRRIEKSDKFGTPVLSYETPPAGGTGVTQDPSIKLALSVSYAQK